jgi:micrococcal nuclease
MYEYNAVVVRIVDGDTVILDVDLGFYMYVRMSCRLSGINCLEMNEPGGSQAKTYLAGILPIASKVLVHSIKPDKYAGRFDGIIVYNGMNINENLVISGYAVPWTGSGPRPVPTWPIEP